jgi:AraC-like DNA-binding protein
LDAPPEDFRLLGFSTDDVAEQHRFSAWCEILSRKLLRVEGKSLSERPYRANTWMRILPGLRTGTGAIAASHYVRTRRTAASDNDDFVLIVNLEGRFDAVQRRREVVLEPGDAYVMACAEPGSYTRSSDGIQTCIRFPARAVAASVPDLYDRVARLIPGHQHQLHLLLSYVRAMDSISMDEPRLRQLSTAHVYDLLAAALDPALDNDVTDGGGLDSGRLSAARAYVSRHCVRDDLSLDEVARHLGLSPRQLQRLFAGAETTFTEFLLGRRLQRVRRALADPRRANHNIGDIALEMGFGDISTFSKAFRRRYGIPPSEFRRMHYAKSLATEGGTGGA